ncbi:MAG TPA: hypothetical protein VNO23_02250 [Candidatus Binatia bacterium]|nr:hypothetical protein [Candidatus Binatia bacterium]
MAPAVDDRFRAAASAYAVYGVVYLAGGLYLIAHGVGVAGARTGGDTTRAMLGWGLVGLIPLVFIPLALWFRWSWLGGWVSRRTFAWLVAALLALRAFKVGEVALRGGGSVPAPWGGSLSFQAGAIVFLAVTLMALAFVLRAAASREP